MEIDD